VWRACVTGGSKHRAKPGGQEVETDQGLGDVRPLREATIDDGQHVRPITTPNLAEAATGRLRVAVFSQF